MKDNLLDKLNDSPKIAEKHIIKYISDLQRHFSLSDDQTVRILNGCVSFFRKKDTAKKWWQIF